MPDGLDLPVVLDPVPQWQQEEGYHGTHGHAKYEHPKPSHEVSKDSSDHALAALRFAMATMTSEEMPQAVTMAE